MKTFVGALRPALTGKHTGRVFTFAFEWENAGREWEFARNIFTKVPFQDVAPGLIAGQRNFRDLQPRKRLIMGFNPDLLIPDFVNIKVIPV